MSAEGHNPSEMERVISDLYEGTGNSSVQIERVLVELQQSLGSIKELIEKEQLNLPEAIEYIEKANKIRSEMYQKYVELRNLPKPTPPK